MVNLCKNLGLYTVLHDITAPLTDSDGALRLFKVKPVDLSVGDGQPEDVGQPTNIADCFHPPWVILSYASGVPKGLGRYRMMCGSTSKLLSLASTQFVGFYWITITVHIA